MTLRIPYYLVDAFTTKAFGGNPASVCVLESWPPDALLQDMTREHNQSETAFIVGADGGYELRWFTSLGEIDLCGHATLASAHVIFEHLGYKSNEIVFFTRFMGNLRVHKTPQGLLMDFPVRHYEPVNIPHAAIDGFGGLIPKESFIQRDLFLVYDDEDTIRALQPDMKKLAELGRAVCVTAQGDDCDFVSRYFCPGDAVEEDPVTGSTHAVLVPYWARLLGKHDFHARQLSQRAGDVYCKLDGERVFISGTAITYMHGHITLDI